jgi:hypothetical protein
MADRRPRDLDLLDKVDALPGTPYEGTVWRIAREARDLLQGYPTSARWDPGMFDVRSTRNSTRFADAGQNPHGFPLCLPHYGISL